MVISSIGHCNGLGDKGDDSSVRILNLGWTRHDMDRNNGGVQSNGFNISPNDVRI